jgi:hypothetical protein
LRSGEEVSRIEKPEGSRVVIEHHEEFSVVRIPSRGWNLSLVFPVFLICTTILMAIPPPDEGGFNWPSPLLVLFLLPLIWIIPSFARIRVEVGQMVSVTWSILGLAWTKRKPVMRLVKIIEHPVQRSEDSAQYGVGMFFDDGSNIAFGSLLEEAERKWLVGELWEMAVRQQSSIEERANQGK